MTQPLSTPRYYVIRFKSSLPDGYVSDNPDYAKDIEILTNLSEEDKSTFIYETDHTHIKCWIWGQHGIPGPYRYGDATLRAWTKAMEKEQNG